jgi:hypothetical protein
MLVLPSSCLHSSLAVLVANHTMLLAAGPAAAGPSRRPLWPATDGGSPVVCASASHCSRGLHASSLPRRSRCSSRGRGLWCASWPAPPGKRSQLLRSCSSMGGLCRAAHSSICRGGPQRRQRQASDQPAPAVRAAACGLVQVRSHLIRL